MVGPPLIDSIRRTLEMMIPVSFAATDVVVKAERSDLPRRGDGDSLAHSTHAIIAVENRSSGVLLVYRADPFDEQERQIVEIFAAQVSLLIGQMNAREQIQGLADTDDLTGIANKRHFRRQLPQEMERARVYSLPMALLMFDIDDFKAITTIPDTPSAMSSPGSAARAQVASADLLPVSAATSSPSSCAARTSVAPARGRPDRRRKCACWRFQK
jgi:hypothetical protein